MNEEELKRRPDSEDQDALDLKPLLKKGGRAVVEKNIKTLLRRSFNDVEFSILKKGARATRIAWLDGPSLEEVEALVDIFKKKRQEGARTSFLNQFGGVEQIELYRRSGEDVIERAIDLAWNELHTFFPSLTVKPTVRDYLSGVLINHPLKGKHPMRLKSFQSIVFEKMNLD